jgi:hypothetical protein
MLIAWGPDADRRAKLLIHLAVEGALLGAYSHLQVRNVRCWLTRAKRMCSADANPDRSPRLDPKSGSHHRRLSSVPPQRLRGHAEGPQERATHAFAVCKTGFLRDHFNRVPLFLDHEPGSF